ncbi:MAG: hypothetical protein R3D01_00235 [Hyphomicrobiales bacterium]
MVRYRPAPKDRQRCRSRESLAQWGVEIASSFDKQQALDEFAQAQKSYNDIIGSHRRLWSRLAISISALTCTIPRIALDDRDAADKL